MYNTLLSVDASNLSNMYQNQTTCLFQHLLGIPLRIQPVIALQVSPRPCSLHLEPSPRKLNLFETLLPESWERSRALAGSPGGANEPDDLAGASTLVLVLIRGVDTTSPLLP